MSDAAPEKPGARVRVVAAASDSRFAAAGA